MLQPGTSIGRYVVTRLLAEGGMAEIYLGTATGPEGFEKDVVIKRIRSFLAKDSNFVDMFKAEARLASRLNHANIVQVFDFAEHEDTYFIAMEYVHGVSLWELRRRARELGVPLSPTLVGEIGACVARGLQYAHALTDRGQGLRIVHRDVTPHNVLLSFDGAVKLTDFGIAKASSNLTTPGMLKGKFAYMAPEQARGETVDGRTDLFALGIVLWELLTGGRLFEADNDVAVLRAVQDSVIVPPQRLNPLVPAELNQVVVRALSRPPAERFQSAQEMERALANFVLRNATSVEDKSVASVLARLYPDELAVPAKEYSTGPSAPADTVKINRTDELWQAAKELASAPLPQVNDAPLATPPPELSASVEKPVEKTAKLPSRNLSPVIAEVQAQPWPGPEQDVKVSRPESHVETSSRILVDEAALRTPDVEPTQLKPKVAPAKPQSTSTAVVWGTLITAAILGTAYALWPQPNQPAPTVPAVVTPAPAERAAVAAAVEPVSPLSPPSPVASPAEPPTAAPPAPAPEPLGPAVVATKNVDAVSAASTKPAPSKGILEIVATPYAHVTLAGKDYGAVQGKKRLTLSPGTYGIIFSHPKRTETQTVTVKAGRTEVASFSAF